MQCPHQYRLCIEKEISGADRVVMPRQNTATQLLNQGFFIGIGITAGTLLVKGILAFVDKTTGIVPDEIDYKSGYTVGTGDFQNRIYVSDPAMSTPSRVVYADDPTSYAQDLYGYDPDRSPYQSSYVRDEGGSDEDFQ